MKIVLDANVVIGAFLLKNSITSIAFEKAFDEHTLLTSLSVLKEINENLPNKKFDKYVDLKTRIEFVMRFEREAKLIIVTHMVSICRDSKDNQYLELLLSGHGDCLMTRDKDLLVLNPFENIPIITPKEFLDQY